MTREFQDFTRGNGNDFSAPIPAAGFPGLDEVVSFDDLFAHALM